MLEWLSSKFTMMVAGMLVLMSTLTLLGIQRGGIEDFELKQIAEKISSNVNSVLSTNAETSLMITFYERESNIQSQGESDLLLPARVGGQTYTINLTQEAVMVCQDQKGFFSLFSAQVHLWNPHRLDHWNNMTIQDKDEMYKFLVLNTGSGFKIENKKLMMEEEYEFHTFIYRE